MVAYTAPDCLPYFECDDPTCLNTGTTCEPSTVWCDMTAILETVMNDFDSTVARTATQVPFFKLARTTEQLIDNNNFAIDFGTCIEWDSVLADNDNMVNLDVESRGAFIQTPGIWQIELYVEGFPPQTTNNKMIGDIRVNDPLSIARGNGIWRSGLNAFLRAGASVALSEATLGANGTTLINAQMAFSGTATPNSLIHVLYAEMSGLWIAEA